MQHGHVTDHKQERSGKNANWWYATEEAQEVEFIPIKPSAARA
jgi:hypothetical protein